MSRAALVNAGLLYIVVVQPLLLVLFIRAVIRAPAGPDSPDHPEPRPAEAPVAAPAPRTAALPRRQPPPEPRPAWPAVGTASQPSDDGYMPRHATRSGPPWRPAPRPPGASW